MERQPWCSLTTSQRRVLLTGTAVQLSLAASALAHLAHRPRDEVRWRPVAEGVIVANLLAQLLFAWRHVRLRTA